MNHPAEASLSHRIVVAVGLVSCALLMTELALTRIFSVTMYYHFAFLAISIALFGLSASGVYVFVARGRLARVSTTPLLAGHALVFAAWTVIALWGLVRLRVGLNYSPENLAKMILIYGLAAMPFFTGGAVISLAITRYAGRINLVYAADLVGAAAGCLLLIPLLDSIGAPGSILGAALLAGVAAVLFAEPGYRWRTAGIVAVAAGLPAAAQLTTAAPFDVRDTKGHAGDRVLFSRWNSFSRVAVYDREHGEWSLSPKYTGSRPASRFMDIDSAASTPIVAFDGRLEPLASLRYELTSLAYRFRNPGETTGPRVLVIGPGGGRDLLAALVFGASRVDGVEINPIIARDVMLGAFREFSGGIYAHPQVRVAVDDGRSFIRRSRERYDVIQASLVDTWAATAAGAYTLSENSLYTVEAFTDYLDHLTPGGVLTITRWTFDGLRLVSLAQEACARRGCDAAAQMAIVRHDTVATFLLKRTPFNAEEIGRLRAAAGDLGFTVLYAPDDRDTPAGRALAAANPGERRWRTGVEDYARLVLSRDRHAFYDSYVQDIRPTTDDRPFFFHTTRLEHQLDVAFGRGMLFGNGLSALLSLMAISGSLVVLFVVGPLALTGRALLGTGWAGWLFYFGCLGAGFMLIEVSILQQFVLLLGHPVYSLTVTLFSLLLGTGAGSYLSRRIDASHLRSQLLLILGAVIVMALLAIPAIPAVTDLAIEWSRPARVLLAVCLLLPVGLLLGAPLPSGIRLLTSDQPTLVPWAWALNGALSVVGATLAVFIAMNWGFAMTLLTGAGIYGLAALFVATRRR